MFRQVFLSALLVILSTVMLGCSDQPKAGESSPTATPTARDRRPQRLLPDGQYPVQQVTYDDGDGTYKLMVLNVPQGYDSLLQVNQLPMARLTDEQLKAGQQSQLQVAQGQPTLYLTEDFKIQYVHQVTQTVNNAQTGRPETVVVRQESNFWAPFAGSLAGQIAGQAIGNMLFRPQYYVPPMYQSGMTMRGYGGYGQNYEEAVRTYRDRYQDVPPAVKNRTVFRSTGKFAPNQPDASNPNRGRTDNRDRSSGSGYGSSALSPSQESNQPYQRSKRSFGSGRGSRSFGSRRR